jgi:endonuclease YncB( thermonuclease family)
MTPLHRMCGVALVIYALTSAQAASALEACRLQPSGSVGVAAVRDGRTLALRDGRELRLAAIETPGGNHAADAKAALQALVDGQSLNLKRLGPDTDRYGRLYAFAFLPSSEQSLQQILLKQGQARVAARVGAKPCADLLLAAERAARATRRGLWADPIFAPLPADDPDRIAAKRGQFALVEGKVVSVHVSGATIYVNFGRRWTRGFTAIILRRQQRAFAAAGVVPKDLEGRRIRVRGWIEQRNGPIIEADAPEQIEFADQH